MSSIFHPFVLTPRESQFIHKGTGCKFTVSGAILVKFNLQARIQGGCPPRPLNGGRICLRGYIVSKIRVCGKVLIPLN